MSQVYRALEKAEREKQLKMKADPIFEDLPVEPIRPKPEIPRPVVSVPALTVDFPVREGGGIPLAPLETIAAEQFRKLRTSIFRNSSNSLRSILVTSAFPREGKTTVTMNLAISMSQAMHKKIILIDADLRNPGIYPEKYNNGKGLADYLSGRASLQEILKHLDEGKFVILPAGRPMPSAAELVGSKKMRDLIKDLKDHDEETYILIDSPPILSASESLMLSEWVDGVVLVVLADRNPKGSVRKAVDSLNRKKILGVVFNQKENKETKYYSDYNYKRPKK